MLGDKHHVTHFHQLLLSHSADAATVPQKLSRIQCSLLAASASSGSLALQS